MNTFYFGIFVVSGVGNRALVIDPGNNSVLVDAAVADLNVSSAKTAQYATLQAKYGQFLNVGNEQEIVIGIDLADNLPISAILMAGFLNSGTTYTQVCMLVKRNGNADQVLATYSYDADMIGGVAPKANTVWRDSENAFVMCTDSSGNAQVVRLSVDGTSSLSPYDLTLESVAPHVVRTATGERLLYLASYHSDTSEWVSDLRRNIGGIWTTVAAGAASYPATLAQVQAAVATAGLTAVSITGLTADEGSGYSVLETWDTGRAFIQTAAGGYVVQNVDTAATTDLATTITERTGGTSLSGGPAFLYLDADLPARLGFWRNLVGVVETEIP